MACSTGRGAGGPVVTAAGRLVTPHGGTSTTVTRPSASAAATAPTIRRRPRNPPGAPAVGAAGIPAASALADPGSTAGPDSRADEPAPGSSPGSSVAGVSGAA